MGRLFWKFFFFIWLAQVSAILGIGGTLWLKHRDQSEAAGPPDFRGGPGPGMRPDDRPPPPGRGPRGAGPGPGEPPPPGVPPMPRGGNLPPPDAGDQLHSLVPMIFGFIASLIFAALLARYFSKPIHHLRIAFDAAAAGNLDQNAAAKMGKRRDELADLGRDFDLMTSRIRALMDGQRRLLHDVSHELRSPLARLQAAIGLVRQQPEKLGATLDRIERESVRMDRLLGELLTLSRLEGGVTGAMEEEIQLGELLAEIVDDAHFEAELSGRAVALSGPCDVAIRGRHELLYRAIENVVRNAVKHTAAGTSVTVETRMAAGGQAIHIAVLDRGPGVAEAELKTIFEPFFRSSRTAGSTDGHGLGLAIAQRVAAAHGGKILASNRLGGGLCVEIVIPLNA